MNNSLETIEQKWRAGKISDEVAVKEFGKFCGGRARGIESFAKAVLLWNEAQAAVRHKVKQGNRSKGITIDRNRARWLGKKRY